MKKIVITALLLAGSVSAQLSVDILSFVGPLICELLLAFVAMGGGIASLMFVYAGVKYLMSADDPAGRKAAKDMILHAIIAIIIITIGAIIVDMVSGVTDFGCAPPG